MSRRSPNCSEVVKHVCEELDADLRSRRCREIRLHLKRCPNCRAYLESLKKTVQLYQAFSPPPMPQHLLIRSRIRRTRKAH